MKIKRMAAGFLAVAIKERIDSGSSKRGYSGR